MTQTTEIGELSAALVKAQGAIEGASKSATNPHYKSSYADLGAVWDACREPLTSNGLAIVQMPRFFENEMRLVTRIIHSSGQWMEDDGFPLLLGKQDMQGLGSATTYARRYGLMAAVGIAPEDDDGNAAGNNGEGQKVKGQGQNANASKPQNQDAKTRAKTWIDGRIAAVKNAKSAVEISDIDQAIRSDKDAVAKMNWIINNVPDWAEELDMAMSDCNRKFAEAETKKASA